MVKIKITDKYSWGLEANITLILYLKQCKWYNYLGKQFNSFQKVKTINILWFSSSSSECLVRRNEEKLSIKTHVQHVLEITQMSINKRKWIHFHVFNGIKEQSPEMYNNMDASQQYVQWKKTHETVYTDSIYMNFKKKIKLIYKNMNS